MVRWPIQFVVVLVFSYAAWMGIQLARERPYWRECLREVVPWLIHGSVFYIVGVTRAWLTGNAPPPVLMFWWAGVLQLHIGIVFIRLFRRWRRNG